MIEILVCAFGIMYTPGPSNLLSLNAGLNGRIDPALRFCLGVACAMLLLFLMFGYTGAWLISKNHQLVISIAGCIYIAYLAYQNASSINNDKTTGKDYCREITEGNLNFKTGLIIQLLNPKAFVAILPIVTVQFPTAQITGAAVWVWSVALSTLAFGAPCCYLIMGRYLGKRIQHPSLFRKLNLCMAFLLLYVACDIAYSHVYLRWE